MKMKNLLLAVSSLAVFTALTSSVAYSESLGFNFTGASDSGSGVLTVSSTGTSGKYTITGITGTADGLAITDLLAPGAGPFAAFAASDNVLYNPAAPVVGKTTPSLLDIDGFSFSLADGVDVNLYFGEYTMGSPLAYNLLFGGSGQNDTLTGFTVFPELISQGPLLPQAGITPEPAAWLLLGTGIVALLGLGRMRRPVAAAVV